MARPSLLSDPELVEQIIYYLAIGVPQRLIAESYGISENTLSGWKKRKDFQKKLAAKTIEIAAEPIEKVRKNQPLEWLMRKFRDEWGPPKQKQSLEIDLTHLAQLAIDREKNQRKLAKAEALEIDQRNKGGQ